MNSPPQHVATAFGFPERDGELTVGSIPVSLLAERVGQTPFYAYDRALMRSRVEELRTTLPHGIRIHYAVKANPMPAVVQHMSTLVDGLDVASGGELRVAMDTGMAARNISFAGPGKSETELAQAVACGILINVESIREVRLLSEIGRRLSRRARVAIRVNPGYELKSSGMKMGGGPKQFGIDAEEVPSLLGELGGHGLVFEGFHIFSGSQNLRAQAICEAQSQALALAVELAGFAPSSVLTLNIGGGLGIPYFPGEKPLDLALVGAHLAAIVGDAGRQLPGCELVIELGRYLVGEAGVYVCQVIDKKISRGHTFLVTNGGLHHHLSASGNFGQVIRKNFPVSIGTRPQASPRERVSVVGPLCTPLDLLADEMELPFAEPGDLVVVFQSGAYGLTASPAQFLGHPAAAEILV